MNQSGKHSAAEPARLENKRERRRVASGRAAALRRAPSDSDCSGETASLSADSGDRAPRAAPLAPPRSGKTRSRRRGSEWEVLEGLKDGQRFEKRPDVFNGYLHKKRKWPLKGWHKRFFVIDGGILVYARSPADVARGRLHGSVDVGLSVISAKARRRRVDIDADEFIYHLRAKTPDVFRTWLNVLKAHRLYRQHLLTFGARESVPKVHPPLEDLPPAENSSNTSFTTESSNQTSIENPHPDPICSLIHESSRDIESSIYSHKDHSAILSWQRETLSTCRMAPLDLPSLEQNIFDLKLEGAHCHNHSSMCSMNYAVRNSDDLIRRKSLIASMNSTDAEKQMNNTDLELSSLKTLENIDTSDKTVHTYKTKVPVDPRLINAKFSNNNINATDINELFCQKKSPFMHNNKQPKATACYFFTRKKNLTDLTDSIMKKSKKCTNLVKYKNQADEPPLKRQSSKCMLLGKYKLTTTKRVDMNKGKNTAVVCSADAVCKASDEVHVASVKNHKSSQKVTTPSECDKITEKLMISIFQRCGGNREDVKLYIDQVVQDLYDVQIDQDMHPVKALFRNLLEYWLKNTSISLFRKAMTSEKSVERQSNKHLTKDKNLSSLCIKKKTKETQFCNDFKINPKASKQKVINVTNLKRNSPKNPTPQLVTPSMDKERQIQELERILRNTIYVCDMGCNNINKEKDIKITKKLIDNLGKYRNNDNLSRDDRADESNSSAELPKIQDTINRLISDASIPEEVAKEFLGAYLDVLMQDSSKSTTVSQSSDWDKQSQEISVECEVVSEAVVKKVSKSVTTLNIDSQKDNVPMKNSTNYAEKQIDPGQVYLKDILDKVTTIFSKVKKNENNKNTLQQNKPKEDSVPLKHKVQNTIKDELGRPIFTSKNDLIYENCDQNSLVIDLSKYNLEQISMCNDPEMKEMMSITIKLKEKPQNHGESKLTHLSLKFPDDTKPIMSKADKCNSWLPFLNRHDSNSSDIFRKLSLDTNKMTCVEFETNRNKIDHLPCFTNSDCTSKARRPIDESYNSLEVSNAGCTKYAKELTIQEKGNEELQPCYVMSVKKGALGSKFRSKNSNKAKQPVCDSKIKRSTEHSPEKSSVTNNSEEQPVFEKRPPRIIDEKFILLLLENLSYLSKTVPNLHKDINTLYQKLKKKHDKLVKNSNIMQGLSLLGKIYSEDMNGKDGDDQGTQYDPELNQDICDTSINRERKNAFTSTNNSKIEVGTKCASTHTLLNSFVKATVQTETIESELTPLPFYCKDPSSREPKTFDNRNGKAAIESETITIPMIDQSTCNSDWQRQTNDAAINTFLRYDLNDAHSKYPTPYMLRQRPYTLERECSKQKTISPRLREELIKEISLLRPLMKMSAQCQTDRHLIRTGAEKRDKSCHVYQLFVSSKCGVKASSSMTVTSSVDVDLSDEMRTLYRCSSDPSYCSGLISPTIRGPQAGFVSGTPGGRLAGWIIESGGELESVSRQLGQAQLSLHQLQRLLDALEAHHQPHHDTDVSLEGASPNVKKDRRKFGLRKKKSNTKCASVELAPPHLDSSTSHTALSSLSALTAPPSPGGGASSMPNSAASLPIACAAARPQSLPGAESLNAAQGPASLTSLTPDYQLREDFTVLAKDLVASLKGVVSTLICERGRARAALEAAESPTGSVVAALRTNLSTALQQNSELRTRLSRIHDASDIAEVASVANSDTVGHQFQQSLSYSSSCVSASEFYDAEEHDDDDLKPDDVIAADEAGVIELDGDSSSEAGSLSSEEGSASSDNSDAATPPAEQATLRHSPPAAGWSRRTRLPAPRPSPGGPSLWNLLYKNIGKDLSQISMPVTINEPLNMLQRLCEELEYSELLDAAATCGSAAERAALVSAFAVSAYAASAHRAASKPFNPLLGETYECVRADRAFRFLAEQVSHHPPISACHAESPRWCFWQEARIKTKFWGKSMEFQPAGRVHVRLNTTGDHYTWNKVTTCVHNLFGGQRWVDQYGDMHISCVGTDIACKLNFVKASSWSQTRHEVRGAVSGGGARLRLAGRWSEALYAGEPPAARCLWRPGAMPPDHELYYGFTRFAMELNEIEPGMREILPHTDTRFRPDQRALEEGDVEAAEAYKLQLEQAQRERRRESPDHRPAWFHKTIEEGEETWVFSGEYWKAREAGFGDDIPRIW